MNRVKFLHSSDLQIGMTRRRLGDDGQARFAEDRLAALGRLGEIAGARDCAFIVLAGDVFEYNSATPTTFGRALEAFRGLPVDCYLLPGNHDPLTADSILRRVAEAEGMEHVHLLESAEPVAAAEGVELVAAPLKSKEATSDPVAAAVSGLEPTAAIRLAVGHGQPLDYGDDRLDHIDVPALEPLFSSGALDYLALGDTHSAQRVDSFAGPAAGGDGRAWFSGAPEVTDFAEEDGGGEFNSGHALIVEVEKDGAAASTVTVDQVDVGRWRFLAMHGEIDSEDDVAAFLQRLRALPEKSRTAVKYALTGTVGLAARRRLETGVGELEPVFAALYERERLMDLHTEPGEAELAELGLSGFAENALAELVERGETDAVNLLFRLFDAEEAK